jgi:hypothetical protein
MDPKNGGPRNRLKHLLICIRLQGKREQEWYIYTEVDGESIKRDYLDGVSSDTGDRIGSRRVFWSYLE